MRLLILSHQTGSVWSAGAERARAFAEWTRTAGHEPIVLTKPCGADRTGFASTTAPIRSTLGASDWLAAARLAWRALFLGPIHLVIVVDDDPILRQSARWCRSWRGWPFVVDAHPDGSPQTKCDEALEPTFDRVPPGRDALRQRDASWASLVDLDEFRPGVGRDLFRSLWHAEDRFLCGVRGGEPTSSVARCLLTTADQLQQQGLRNFGFCVLTNARSTAGWEEAVAAKSLDNVRVLGPSPRAVLPSVLAACDAWLADEPEPERRSLRFEELAVMATGVPLLMPARGPLLDTVLDADAGLAVEVGSPDSLIDALRELADHPGGCRAGRGYVAARHDARGQSTRWTELLAAYAPPQHLALPARAAKKPSVAEPSRGREAA